MCFAEEETVGLPFVHCRHGFKMWPNHDETTEL